MLAWLSNTPNIESNPTTVQRYAIVLGLFIRDSAQANDVPPDPDDFPNYLPPFFRTSPYSIQTMDRALDIAARCAAAAEAGELGAATPAREASPQPEREDSPGEARPAKRTRGRGARGSQARGGRATTRGGSRVRGTAGNADAGPSAEHAEVGEAAVAPQAGAPRRSGRALRKTLKAREAEA